MIYDRTNVVENYRGLIGFRPSYDSSNAVAKVDADLAQSLSGQYVNDLHPYFTPEVFSNTAEQFTEFSVIPWSSTKTYQKDEVISYDDEIYQALQGADPNLNKTPSSNDDYWKKTSLLSVWYQNRYDSAVLKTIDALADANRLDTYSKQLVATMGLYDTENRSGKAIAKTAGRFVGFEIDVSQPNTMVTLQRIGMQLTGSAPTTVPIHIIYNGVDTEIPVEFRGNSRFNYVDLAPVSFYYGMGSVQIGYFEDDLGSESAINFVSETFAHNPCYACGNNDTGRREIWGKYITVTPFSEDADGTYTENYASNFGLNLALSFRCDLSDVLIREKFSVVSALKAMLRVTFLEAIALNVRNNQQADQVSILAYNQLEAYQDPFSPKNELKRAIKALQFELSGINPLCMPCNNKMKIRNRVI
jgi:hypothetical protein